MKTKLLLLVALLLGLICQDSKAQTSIQYVPFLESDHLSFGFGSYGRIGVGWMPAIESTEGRRLNLNNMGSVGGRFEEQDYMELGMAFHIRPDQFPEDSTEIVVQVRSALYSNNLQYFGNSSTGDALSSLTLAFPEIFVEAKNVLVPHLNIWVGSRLYRGPDVHMADYFYFNDHSGQGFGAEYRNSRASVSFVSSSDTTSTVPPYFFLNIKSGTPSLELRQRVLSAFEHDIHLGSSNLLTILGEWHHMGDPSDEEIDANDPNILASYPGDDGWVLGAKYQWNELQAFAPGSFNHTAIRYGSGIANGGDGGNSRTWNTFGAANLDTYEFKSAYSWHIVDHFLLNFRDQWSVNGYGIFNKSKGAASTKGLAETYLGREVYNSKMDWTLGVKVVKYLSDQLHMQAEVHHSERKDGTEPWYAMTKFSLVPTLAPTGKRSVWARPHLRFVASAARYNDAAMDAQYSPYLQLVGNERWGYYFGVKAEWWTW